MNDQSLDNSTSEMERPREAIGPGRRLRKARESHQLNIEDVATELRLNPKLVRALEEDDHANLPPAIFITGYLRSYARLLGLPAEEVVARYEGRTVEPPPLTASMGGREQVSSRDLPVRLVTYLLVAGLIALLVMWWFSQRPVPEPILPAEVPGDSLQAPITDEVATLEGEIEGKITESAPGEMPLEVEEVAESTEALPAEDEGSAVEGEEPAPTPFIELPPPPPVRPTPLPLTAQTPQSVIRLEFQADSWVEVTDAAGRQLASGLMDAGHQLELRGEAPFRLVLGFAPAATVYYNGELFDHTPYQRGDVARFRLGRASHNRLLSE